MTSLTADATREESMALKAGVWLMSLGAVAFIGYAAIFLARNFTDSFLEQFGSEDVRAVLARLPDLYRIPLVLVYVDGFATKEVARMLEAPLGTVLARLHRGRKLFEKQLWEYAEEVGLLREGVR